MVKRLRVFAGPNGSGKSTFINLFPLQPNIKLGQYVNADDIEVNLKDHCFIDLNAYGIETDTATIQAHFKHSVFAPFKLQNPELWKNFHCEDHKIIVNQSIEINSYIAADLADFIRQLLLNSGLSFSFETVMSDPSKLNFLEFAKDNNYQIYLYFFCTEDPKININRVNFRVAQSGHNVDAKIIEKRYYRSLANLKNAVKLSHRAYIFDNSEVSQLIAQVTGGKEVQIIDEDNIPDWFIKYIVEA